MNTFTVYGFETMAQRIADKIKLSEVISLNKSYASGTHPHYVIDRSKLNKAYKPGFWLEASAIEVDEVVVELLEDRLDNLLFMQGITR